MIQACRWDNFQCETNEEMQRHFAEKHGWTDGLSPRELLVTSAYQRDTGGIGFYGTTKECVQRVKETHSGRVITVETVSRLNYLESENEKLRKQIASEREEHRIASGVDGTKPESLSGQTLYELYGQTFGRLYGPTWDQLSESDKHLWKKMARMFVDWWFLGIPIKVI